MSEFIDIFDFPTILQLMAAITAILGTVLAIFQKDTVDEHKHLTLIGWMSIGIISISALLSGASFVLQDIDDTRSGKAKEKKFDDLKDSLNAELIRSKAIADSLQGNKILQKSLSKTQLDSLYIISENLRAASKQIEETQKGTKIAIARVTDAKRKLLLQDFPLHPMSVVLYSFTELPKSIVESPIYKKAKIQHPKNESLENTIIENLEKGGSNNLGRLFINEYKDVWALVKEDILIGTNVDLLFIEPRTKTKPNNLSRIFSLHLSAYNSPENFHENAIRANYIDFERDGIHSRYEYKNCSFSSANFVPNSSIDLIGFKLSVNGFPIKNNDDFELSINFPRHRVDLTKYIAKSNQILLSKTVLGLDRYKQIE
ncbi:hypothetical protein [Dyadobacter sp. CY323]|uniref:hypothetical protein n=1 Tax=Dyadobacter sp. CY323 TaxID=2907302 RepID=UPI001F17CCAA|nr:hypothetical protein [Dyadobacter sp. CY323]MCE6993121.1 hypothetical protein [Dyadobacter sp. CY323]